MALPKPVEKLWDELERARAGVLREAEGMSQRQADWKPSEREWSVGEIIDHLTLAEINTGKLTSKLLKEVPASAVFPADLTEFAPVPGGPLGPAEAPQVVWPGHGKSIDELIATMKSTRARSRQSIERLATCDPRTLTFKHFRLGEMDLGQWWRLQASHDLSHLQQLREVKAAPGFPGA
jgi:DinB superfamily